MVIDAAGRPLCTEMWPGNTADVSILLPVVDRLRGRFAIGRVCVVADRGMISEATIAGLEQRGLEYILGVRERSDRLVREVVLADERPLTPLVVERADGGETQLFAKEVLCEGRRYILCRNEAEAAKDRADRQAILNGLERQLARGDKALIGNSAYRRYLRRTRKGEPAFEIDPASLAEEAKFDGVFVLRDLHPPAPAAGDAALSRPFAGRGAVPPHQVSAAHAADLPLLGRRHPRPRVLLLPRADAAEGARHALRRQGLQARMAGPAARP